MKEKIDKRKQGKRNRQSGGIWERKVRADLELKGWLVCKFSNNVDFDEGGKGKMIPAKRKYNPFSRAFSVGTGFPDFICWKTYAQHTGVIGVEAKSNGYLDKKEKVKCRWLLDNKIFSNILIAKKKQEGRKIVPEYTDFEDIKIRGEKNV